MLHYEDWQLIANVLAQLIGPIFKSQSVLRLDCCQRFGTIYWSHQGQNIGN